MRGILTKTEKILIICTAVFLAVLCGTCFAEIAAGRNGSWHLETTHTAAPGAVIPSTAGLININTASAELLTELPGIGKALAARIIEYRAEHGPFRFKSELLMVEGIGAATYRNIEDQITVEDDGR